MRSFTCLITICLIANLSAGGDFDSGLQLRYRFEQDAKDFNHNTAGNNFSLLRARIHFNYFNRNGVNAFVQFQDSRTFGEEASTLEGSADQFDLHQGFLKIDSLWGKPVHLKLGRFEATYSNQRLIGNVGWSNVGRSFDGITLSWLFHDGSIDFFSYQIVEELCPGDGGDLNFSGIWFSQALAQGIKADFYGLWRREVGPNRLNEITVGINTTIDIGDMNVESEFAYQTGQVTKNTDISAIFLAFNGTLRFRELAGKPLVSAGVDYLSGDKNLSDNTYAVFNTLYATNHKFYGIMDYFIDIPLHTSGLGLTDIHIKFDASLCAFVSTSIRFHRFMSSEKFTLSDGSTRDLFGDELDLIVTYTYDQDVSLQLGAATFAPGVIFKEIRGADNSYFLYLTTTVSL